MHSSIVKVTLLTAVSTALVCAPAAAAPVPAAASTVLPAPGVGSTTQPAAVPDLSAPAAESNFSADPLPTVQVNDLVKDVVVSGGRGFAVGDFTSARPAGVPRGQQETPRAGVLAFDLATGELDGGFTADTDGPVNSVAVTDDGSTVLIAGTFHRVGGQARRGFAALDAATGAVLPLDARLNSAGHVVATRGTTAYVAGTFDQAQGQSRPGMVAIDLGAGTVTPWRAEPQGGAVRALTVSPDGGVVVAGGHFTAMSGAPARGIARLDGSTGALLRDGLSDLVRSGGNTSAIIAFDGDEQGFYLSGYKWNVKGGLEGIVAARWDGSLRWVADCHGDSVGVWSAGAEVLSIGHPYSCATLGAFPQNDPPRYHGLVAMTNTAPHLVRGTAEPDYTNFVGRPAPQITGLVPEFGVGNTPGQSAWAIDGDATHVVVAGDFPTINSEPQEGIVRFAREGAGPDAVGPQDDADIRVTPTDDGRVRVLVTPTWDRDDTKLVHRLETGGRVLDERTVTTAFWSRPTYSVLTDPAEYVTLTVTDPHGNSVARSVPATTGAASAAGPYARRVLGDGAARLWSPGPGEAAARAAIPGATGDSLVPRGGASQAQGLLGPAVRLDGGALSYAASSERSPEVHELSVEAWIRPEAGRGGRIIGFGARATGANPLNDRVLYLDDSGRLHFGTRPPRTARVISSPQPLAFDRWHHVVATLGADGTHRLYVDGAQVAAGAFASGALPTSGYWSVGADDMSIWPSRPARRSMTGLVDSPAVYHRVLTAQEVADHHALGACLGALPGGQGGDAGLSLTWRHESAARAVSLDGPACGNEALVGDWDGDGVDETGMRVGLTFVLHDSDGSVAHTFDFGRPTDEVLVGDFDGDGADSIGLRRGNLQFVDHAHDGGLADAQWTFGKEDDRVFVGDFDGDGRDTVGVRRGNVFYIQNSFAGGEAHEEMSFGRAGDEAVVGDWDGDGRETIALRREAVTYATDGFAGGKAEIEFVYGRPSDEIVVGDFDGDGRDSLTMRRGTTFHVADELRPGEADRSVDLGAPDSRVVGPRTPGRATPPATVLVGAWGEGPADAETFAVLGLE